MPLFESPEALEEMRLLIDTGKLAPQISLVKLEGTGRALRAMAADESDPCAVLADAIEVWADTMRALEAEDTQPVVAPLESASLASELKRLGLVGPEGHS